MDCVHDGQELAPKVSDITDSNGNINGCGINPSGKNWWLIIGGSLFGLLVLCCCCCLGFRYYKNKKKQKLTKEFEMLDENENDEDNIGMDNDEFDGEDFMRDTTGDLNVTIQNVSKDVKENEENLISNENVE
eukprot:430753_1